MRLTALEYAFNACLVVSSLVRGSDSFWRAINNHINLPKHVIHGADDFDVLLQHRGAAILIRRKDWNTEYGGSSNAVICGNIDNTDQIHVLLELNGIGDALADHAVSVDAHQNLFHSIHL